MTSSDRPSVFIEKIMPVELLNQQVYFENGGNPFKGLHRWYSRKPLSFSRASVLGSLLPAEVTIEEFEYLLGLDRPRTDRSETQLERENRWQRTRLYKTPPSPERVKRVQELCEQIWGDRTPAVLDAFAGGGSIPFEAARYGLRVFASDLNPVAVVTMKAAIEFPLKFGAELQQDIDKWVKWVEDEAEKRLAEFFPAQEGETIQNYLWAHTVVCPSCQSVVPLSPNWWLSKTSNYAGKGQERKVTSDWYAVKPIPNPAEKRVDFELIRGKKWEPTKEEKEQFKEQKIKIDTKKLGIRVKNEKITPDDFSTIGRGVGKCPNCENVIEDQVIKHQATNGGLGHQLYAVSFNQGKGSLEFRTPSQSDLDGVEKAHDYLQQKNSNYSLGSFILDIEIPKGEETDRLPKIGIEKWDQLFNPRQLLTLVTYVEIINEAKEKIRAELDEEKAAAIVTYLAMVLDRCVDRNCRLSIWHTARASVERASTQHALNLTWNYPEITGSRELWRGCADPVSSEYQGLCELLGNESQLIQLIQPDPELSKVTPRPRNPDLVAQIKAMAEQRNLPYSPQYLPYNKKLVDRAKELRKNMTPAEKKLWHEFLKYCDDRFWRQRPIDHFIVDFYCPARYLVIEIDGASHDSDEAQAYDEERTKVLEGYGLTVLRFTNQEVLENFEGVCEAIGNPPQPPFGRGESPPTPLWKGGVELELDDGSEVPFGRGESEGSEVPLEKGDLGGYQCHITAASADSLFHLADRSLDAIVTDPPYYSTIQYAELSDFFYVWQKHILGDIFPDLYTTELTDKDREAVANPSRFRNMGASPKDLADQDYEAKMQMAFSEYYRVLKDNGVMTVQFNHKDSGAWDVLAKSLIDAGFEITASWAVSTENPQNLHQAQKNSVSSTVLLVCRKRDPNAGSAWWDEVRIELSNTVTEKAPELEEALTPPNKEHHNPGINLYISAFGPALNVFSRAWPVLDSAGVEMRPEVAFEEARKAIVNYRFHKLIQTDAAGFDSLTQWYIIAWDAFRAREFPFDEARQLALAIGGFNVNDLAKTHKLLDSTSGTCKLLTPQQRLKKRIFSTNADEFSALSRPLVDGLHAIIAIYLEEQSIEPVRRFLKGTGLISNDLFMRSWEVALKAIPHIGDERKRIEEEKALADLWLAMDEIQAKVTYVQPSLGLEGGQMDLF